MRKRARRRRSMNCCGIEFFSHCAPIYRPASCSTNTALRLSLRYSLVGLFHFHSACIHLHNQRFHCNLHSYFHPRRGYFVCKLGTHKLGRLRQLLCDGGTRPCREHHQQLARLPRLSQGANRKLCNGVQSNPDARSRDRSAQSTQLCSQNTLAASRRVLLRTISRFGMLRERPLALDRKALWFRA